MSHALTHIQLNAPEASETAREGKHSLLESHCELCASVAQCSDLLPLGFAAAPALSSPDFLTHVGPLCARVAHAAAPYQARAPPK
ncbi:hypothetical protein V8J88_13365 [Massilia sp. W12]|uniref:hypothetical protein n=1 Tax=Massilia sp. W12 TaxID=3126507 RepID=UPI0030D4E8EA